MLMNIPPWVSASLPVPVLSPPVAPTCPGLPLGSFAVRKPLWGRSDQRGHLRTESTPQEVKAGQLPYSEALGEEGGEEKGNPQEQATVGRTLS